MTIKRNSDNQISCTISASELAERSLELGDLSYGSKQAKSLVSEIMKIAKKEIGFSSDNLPLVVEAIPMENDDVMFIITKCEYPEELDARFSRFTPADESEYPPVDHSEINMDDTASNIFKHLETLANEMNEEETETETEEGNNTEHVQKESSEKFIPFDYSAFNFAANYKENNDNNIDTDIIIKDLTALNETHPELHILDIYNLKYKENMPIVDVASKLDISENSVIEALNEIIAVI